MGGEITHDEAALAISNIDALARDFGGHREYDTLRAYIAQQRARDGVNPSTVTLDREVVEKVREAMIAARAALLSVDRRGLANTRIESHAMTNALAALEAAAPTAATNAGGGQ